MFVRMLTLFLWSRQMARNIFFKSRQISLACSGDQSDECDHRGRRCGQKEKNTMSTFTIDDNNNITAYASAEEVAEASQGHAAGLVHYNSQATSRILNSPF